MSSTIIAGSFHSVLDDCINGKLSKKQGIKLLEQKYKSASKEIKEEFGEDSIGMSFCCYVPCDFNKWIDICDGAERNKPCDIKWKNSHNIIQKVIDKVTSKYLENMLGTPKNAEMEALNDVMSEVHNIQNLCRYNREITEIYKKYKAIINELPNISTKQNKNTSQDIIQILLDYIPPKVKKHEGKKIKEKIFQDTYWITTSVPDVQSFLEGKQKSGEIIIDDIPAFINTYLRGIKGGDPSRSYITEKSKKKKQKQQALNNSKL